MEIKKKMIVTIKATYTPMSLSEFEDIYGGASLEDAEMIEEQNIVKDGNLLEFLSGDNPSDIEVKVEYKEVLA